MPAFFVDSIDPGGPVGIYRANDEFAYSNMFAGLLPQRDTWELLGTHPAFDPVLAEGEFTALLKNRTRPSSLGLISPASIGTAFRHAIATLGTRFLKSRTFLLRTD